MEAPEDGELCRTDVTVVDELEDCTPADAGVPTTGAIDDSREDIIVEISETARKASDAVVIGVRPLELQVSILVVRNGGRDPVCAMPLADVKGRQTVGELVWVNGSLNICVSIEGLTRADDGARGCVTTAEAATSVDSVDGGCETSCELSVAAASSLSGVTVSGGCDLVLIPPKGFLDCGKETLH